jgi:L,D-transpeptidase YcbB
MSTSYKFVREIVSFCILFLITSQQTQVSAQLVNSSLTTRFHKQLGNNYWLAHPALYQSLKAGVIAISDSAARLGLKPGRYHATALKAIRRTDSTSISKNSKFLTDALITISKDLYQGSYIRQYISNDEVTGKYSGRDDSFLISGLSSIVDETTFNLFICSLEPATEEYRVLKKELAKQLKTNNQKRISELTASINSYRWIHHFHFEKHIVVNIPAATLYYFETDSMKLQMKVVTGKPKTRSPRFATWCYEVVLYPYWNVPPSIGNKELLPKIKKNPALLKEMNMQVLNRNDKIIDPAKINWWRYNSSNFPYRFRQCTGCDNSLGVVKFNLSDPFNVYMHDTNYKLAFLKNTWFLSHGCIRLEKPIELGNYLLDNKIDTALVNACIKGQEPIILKIKEKVPVFVVYMPAQVSGDSVIYHKDVYHLFQ